MRKTIASRFSSAISLMITLSIGTLGIIFMFFTQRYLANDRIDTLNLCVNNGREAYRISLGDYEDLTSTEKRNKLRDNLRLISNTTSTRVLLADEKGKILVCTEETKCGHEGMFLPDDIMRQLSATEKPSVLNGGFAKMYPNSYYTVGLSARDAYGNITGYVFAFSDASSTAAFMNNLMAIFFLCAASMLTISGVVTFFVTDRLTTPLSNISNAAKQFSQGDFSARVAIEEDDEIAHLASTFNQMAAFVEKNEKSRSSFVANIAHELRTPMTSIKGFVDGILDGTIPPERQEKYLKVISDEIGRLARLTNSMLDISKLESGEFVMNVRDYNIWDTIATVAFGFESRIENAGIQLVNFKPEKIMVNADRDLVHQVVYNIFDNALKFTPNGGYIAFSVSEDKSAGMVTVKIKNSGDGVSSEALPYIFERFYKEDTSRSVHVKGAGIGLFIVRTLVTRSGGEIWVESDGKSYTEFIFTLPCAKGKKRTKQTIILPRDKSANRNVTVRKKGRKK